MFRCITVKGTQDFETLSAMLHEIANPNAIFLSAAGGVTVENLDNGELVSFHVIDSRYSDPAISGDDVRDLARLAGIDPREDEADGLHWSYAPSLEGAAFALERFERACAATDQPRASCGCNNCKGD